ncbi:MAG: hypothetical protein ACRDFQ_05385 [Anaerolineales bacterium]
MPTETLPLQIDPTSTNPPVPLIILLKPAGSGAAVAEIAAEVASGYASRRGMRFEERDNLDPAQAPAELAKLILLAPDPGALSIATSLPNVAVIAVGFAPDGQAANLVSLASSGSPEEVAFVAGYMAALTAENWRTGMIYSPQSAHLVDDFISGVEYFCGLCIPAAPPDHEYPQAFQAQDAQTWQAAADALLGQSVRVVYLSPEMESGGAANYLASFGVLLIGSGEPPADISANWIASVGGHSIDQLREQLPALLDGQTIQISAIELLNVNPAFLSDGRQAYVYALISDLLAGLITPGDPLQGN